MSVERSAYEVLTVPASATPREIHLAYRDLARRFHPDGTEPNASRMVELNAAYDELRTPERQLAYDRRIRLSVPLRGRGAGDAGVCERGLGPLGRRVAAARGSTPVLRFGPYAGLHVADVAVFDTGYLRWLDSQAIGSDVREAIAHCLGTASSGDRIQPTDR